MATERQRAAARRNVEGAVGASKAQREIAGRSRVGREELARALGHRGA